MCLTFYRIFFFSMLLLLMAFNVSLQSVQMFDLSIYLFCFSKFRCKQNSCFYFSFKKKKSITKYLYRLARKVNRFYATLITWNFFLKLMISRRVSKAFIYVSQSAHTHSQNMLMMLHILGLVRLLFLSLLVSISQIFVFFFVSSSFAHQFSRLLLLLLLLLTFFHIFNGSTSIRMIVIYELSDLLVMNILKCVYNCTQCI